MEKEQVGSYDLQVVDGVLEDYGTHTVHKDVIAYDFVRVSGEIVREVSIPADIKTFMKIGERYKLYLKKWGRRRILVGIDDGASKHTSHLLGLQTGYTRFYDLWKAAYLAFCAVMAILFVAAFFGGSIGGWYAGHFLITWVLGSVAFVMPIRFFYEGRVFKKLFLVTQALRNEFGIA